MEMPRSDPLIRTKLRLPFIRPSLVPRARLQARIEEGVRGPLTLVVAPAGFGKTTLVAASLFACCPGAAWLSLDPDDNQPGRFLTYLVAALSAADRRIGSEARELLAGMQPAPSEAVLTSLLNDLDACASEVILALDDYQFIASAQVHADLEFLLEHCPNTFHLLIATRSDPPLPLARLRARGQLLELRAADLRFTPAEADQFLNQVMGLALDAGSVSALEERTEGWVAGLQMAALSMRDRQDVQDFIARFSGTNRYILDYLLEEILAGQTPEIQRFLLRTAVLERMTAPLCDALLAPGEEPGDPIPQSAAVLEYLTRANLFLVALDDEREWFRYHHLFADLLRARLGQTQSDLIPALHVRAAGWLEEQGFIREAVQHLLAAQEIDRAADLIERTVPLQWADSDISVMQMAGSLPQDALVARPKLGLYQVWLLLSQGAIQQCFALLNALAEHLAGQAPGSYPRWMQTFIALALALLSRKYPIPDFQALDEIPADEPILGNAADILYGMTLARREDVDRSAEVTEKIIQRRKKLFRPQTVPALVTFLARITLMQGRLHAAAALCREYLDPIQGKDMRFIDNASMLCGILGDVLYEWNSLDEAEQQIRDALRANQLWKNFLTDAWALMTLANIQLIRRDAAGALQTAEQFETRLKQGQSGPFEFSEDLRTFKVRVQLAATGDLQKASQWADQIQFSEDFQRHPEYYRMTIARIRLAQGRFAEVERILTETPPPGSSGSRTSRQVEIAMTLAMAIAGQGRMPEVLALVEACLALAAPEGYLRTFLDLGWPAQELLASYASSPSASQRAYAQQILAAWGPGEPVDTPGHDQSGLIEPLTPRELDVLGLLAQGLTNRQIAEKLVLSEGTVKFYLHAVLEKLGVHSRTQAIVAARQHGLV